MKTIIKKGTSAFTLIEMLIVVAIIGILVGIGVPALRDAKSKAADAKLAAANAQLATAANRVILSKPESNVNLTAAELAPYVVVNGKTFPNIANITDNAFAAFVMGNDLGTYAFSAGSSANYNIVTVPVITKN